MFKLQEQRKWTHNIIRPNGIIGFTPGRKMLLVTKLHISANSA